MGPRNIVINTSSLFDTARIIVAPKKPLIITRFQGYRAKYMRATQSFLYKYDGSRV